MVGRFDQHRVNVMLDIYRISTDLEVGTFGVLKWVSMPAPFALSVEDPWRNNEKFVSCIPAGTYKCQRVESPKFGNTFEICDVEGRDLILFHWGNTHVNTQGCVLVGEKFEPLNGVPAVLGSKDGFREFLAFVEGLDEFDVTIRWIEGIRLQ